VGYSTASTADGVGDDDVVMLQQVTVDVLGYLLCQHRVLRQLVNKRHDLTEEIHI